MQNLRDMVYFIIFNGRIVSFNKGYFYIKFKILKCWKML